MICAVEIIFAIFYLFYLPKKYIISEITGDDDQPFHERTEKDFFLSENVSKTTNFPGGTRETMSRILKSGASLATSRSVAPGEVGNLADTLMSSNDSITPS